MTRSRARQLPSLANRKTRRDGARLPRCRPATEPLESRALLTAQPVDLADPATYGVSGAFASYGPSISADGQLVAYLSHSDDLVTNDTNGLEDAFLYDRGTGAVSLVSVGVDGQAAGATGSTAVVSPDGRYVAFESAADSPNGAIVPGVRGDELYLRDLSTGTTTLLSAASDGHTGGNGYNQWPLFSADSHHVVFTSSSTNLVAGVRFDNVGQPNVFERDLVSGVTKLVSASLDGASDGNATSGALSGGGITGYAQYGVSADGRYVAFQSNSTNLVSQSIPPQDNHGVAQVYVRDMAVGTTTLASVDFIGQAGGDGHNQIDGSGQVMSADGRFVVFNSEATDLTATPPSGGRNVYLRDLRTGTTTLVSTSAVNGVGVGGGSSEVLSPDGRFAAFATASAGVVAMPTAVTNVYVKNIQTGAVTLASVNAAGTAGGNGGSGLGTFFDVPGGLSFSGNGRLLAFRSLATDLTGGVKTANRNLYVRDLDAKTTTLVTPNLDGTDGGAGAADTATSAALSADGRVIAFEDTAGDLVAGDHNGVNDVFARDLTAGSTVLASLRSPLLPAERLASRGGSLDAASPDGRYVLFNAPGGNDLTPGVAVDSFSVHPYLRDVQAGTTRVVDLDPDGKHAENNAYGAAVTPDGRYVVFFGTSPTLVTGISYYSAFGELMAFERDMVTGKTTIVGVNPAGTHDVNVNAAGPSPEIAVSADGRYVAFTSADTTAVDGLVNPNNHVAVFLRDMQAGTTVLVSRDQAADGKIDGDSSDISISADGRYVVFDSTAPDLVAGDGNAKGDVFRWDRTTGQVALVSVNAAGNAAGNEQSGDSDYYRPQMTPDGRFVVFGSKAGDLVAGDANANWDVFVRDMQAGVTKLASVGASGGSGNADSELGSLSADGRYAVFISGASNLVAADTNNRYDVFVRDLQAGTTTLVSINAAGNAAGNAGVGLRPVGPYPALARPTISAEGRYVAFRDQATDLVPGITYTPGFANLFVRDLTGGTTKLITTNGSGTATPNGDTGGTTPLLTTGGAVLFDTAGHISNPPATDLFPGDLNGVDDIFAASIAGLSTIAGQVFDDRNGNGAADGGEPGLASWTVYLDANGNGTRDIGEPLAVTDATGHFALRGLTPGTYRLAITPQVDFATTTAGGTSRMVTIAADGTTTSGQDFGESNPQPDLATSAVSVDATSAGPGKPVAIHWTVANVGAGPASGDWVDALYLSPTPTIGADAVPFAEVPHSGGLAAGGTYNGGATLGLPPIASGTYYLIVQADRRNQVAEGRDGANEANNVSAATTPLSLTVPPLTPGTPVRDSFTTPGEGRYYAIAVDPGQTLRLTLTSDATDGATELYVRRGAFPDPSDFDASARMANAPSQTVDVPTTSGGLYYVYARAAFGTASHAGFTLSASLPTFSAASLGLGAGGNTGRVTIPIRGALLSASTQVSLVSGATVIPAASVVVEDASLLYVTFDLTGRPVGAYDVQLRDSGRTAVLSAAFSVVPGSSGGLQVSLGVPAEIRAGGADGVVLRYVNAGNTDLPAPLFVVMADHALFSLPDAPGVLTGSIPVLGISTDGPAGVLRAGASGQLTIPARSTAAIGQDIHFQAEVADDSAPMDWAAYREALRPASVPASAWDAVFANFTARVGATVGTFHSALADDATYLGALGEPTPDANRLIAFELNKADAALTPALPTGATDASLVGPGLPLTFGREFQSTLTGRSTPGPFGLGWVHGWQVSLATDPQGDVAITQGATVRRFAPRRDGGYEASPGDFATLVFNGGVYRLREADGRTLAFNADGTLADEQDPNGNRIIAGYSGGRLVSLTHSDGDAIGLSYNAQGLIEKVTATGGDSTTYAYDGAGHLIAATDRHGVTSYTYLTGQTNPALEGALARIVNPDGTEVAFEYDGNGRPIGRAAAGGLGGLTYTYNAAGGYAVTDAVGGTGTYEFDDSGALGRYVDPLGREVRLAYNTSHLLTSATGPLGATTTYTYDGSGNLSSEVDPLGNRVSYVYDAAHHLLAYTDARGNTTRYGRDGAGDLLSITYPGDGASQRFEYDPLGNPITAIDARGEALRTTFDAQGRPTLATFSDGTTETFAYDARGHLTRVTDRTGGVTTLTYDAAGDLAEVDYPGARFLKFRYNAVGSRTQSTDQSGFTVNYTYDAAGRLDSLTDGGGQLIARYVYDAAGGLVEKDLGNGTYSTYEYDKSGHLTRLLNRAPRPSPGQDGPIHSEFAYTYDALGRPVTEATSDGAWTYTYDIAGQLTRAAFASSTPATVPDRDLRYSYDPAGNRTQTIIDGVTTAYTADARNAYTRIGGATFTYDADGNLASAISGGQTTSYRFDQFNRLVGVTGPGGTSGYGYDALGQLDSTTRDGQATQFEVDPGGLGYVTAEFDGSGNLAAHYTYGLGLVSRVDAGGSAGYYDFDLAANTAGITGASGSYVNRYRYAPFGETTTVAAALPNPFTFVGQLGAQQIGDGLTSMRARVYAPTVGQFLSEDPLGLGGGDTNTRRYVGNAPVARIDPAGTGWWDAVKQWWQDITTTTGTPSPRYQNKDPNPVYNPANDARGKRQDRPDDQKPPPSSDKDKKDSNSNDTGGNKQNNSSPPGPGGPQNCFPPDTPVTTEGGLRPIAAIEPGERVWAYDFARGAWRLAEVERRHDARYEGTWVTLDLGIGKLTATAYHPFWVISGADLDARPGLLHGDATGDCGAGLPGRWVDSHDLRSGDVLFLRSGETAQVRRVRMTYDDAPTCNLTVKALHCFAAGPMGALVHNVGGGSKPSGAVGSIFPHGFPFPNPGDMKFPAVDLPPFDLGPIQFGGRSGSPGAFDPNELIGPSGLGAQGFVTGQGFFPYTVAFENDPKKATLAAQDVTVRLPLDPALDRSTFALGDIRFGATTVPVPAGLQSFSTDVDTTSVDGTPLRVAIRAGLDPETGVVTWSFVSLDPATGQSPRSLVAGFLPVDDSTGRGQGYVHFTIRPRAGTSPDPTIREQATVVFDANAPLATNVATNAIDDTPPTSAVAALPATTTATTFPVSWSGADAGSGIARYDVYVATDAGPFTPFRTGTTATSAAFTGAAGHTYRFYSIATDALGHVQAAPAAAQAITQVVAPAAAPSVVQFAADAIRVDSSSGSATVTLTRSGALDTAASVIVSSPGGRDVAAFSTAVAFAAGQSTASLAIPVRAEATPGLPDDVATLTIAASGPSATVGAASRASLVVRDVAATPPPPLVSVARGSVQAIRLGTGKKAKKATALVLTFTAALNPATAGATSAYRLVRAGRDKKFGTKDDLRVAIQSAFYDATRNTVTLVPRGGKLALSPALQVQVSGLALRDLLGRPIDGGARGTAGSDFRALVTRGGF